MATEEQNEPNETNYPTVQAPVSLIEKTRRLYAAQRWDTSDWDALLSQPTPSAETIPAHCANLHPHAPHDYNPDTLRHHALRHCSGEGTKPPRIANMAPEHSYEAMRTDIISALAADGFSYLESEQLLRRFESTIRDVTPPGVTR